MPKTHPDDSTLEKFARGKLKRRENLKLSWHLFNCAACRKEIERLGAGGGDLLESLFEGLNPQDVADNPSYERAFSFGQSTLEARGETRDRDRERAPKLFAELMRHPVSRQRSLIERTWRFKNYVFAEYLLEESLQALFDDPARGEDLADLALVVAKQLEGSHYGPALVNDLKARCWAYIGNARRVANDFRAAEEAFNTADELAEDGSGDPLLEARLLALRAGLSRERHQFEEADEMIQRALKIYRDAGEEHWVGRTLITYAILQRNSGQPKDATSTVKQALENVDAERDPRLVFCAKQLLVNSLLDMDRYKEAERIMPEVNALLDQQNSLDQLRARWTEGYIALGLERLEEAETIFNETRLTFAEREMGYDSALASLDLAAVYLQQPGRTAEVKELAEEMLPIFRSRDVHRESLAALIVFQKAAMAETVTLKMVQEISEYLKEARNNPELSFQQAS